MQEENRQNLITVTNYSGVEERPTITASASARRTTLCTIRLAIYIGVSLVGEKVFCAETGFSN